VRRFLRRLRHGKAARAARQAKARLAARLPWLGTAGASPWLRRGVLAAVLLAVALIPYPVLADQPGLPGCQRNCKGPELNMLRWTMPLSGTGAWTVSSGLDGTSPASGQAYVAVGDGLAAIGDGLLVTAVTENGGQPLWQEQLPGFSAGAQIVSVRTWPDEITVGVVTGTKRTEVVLNGLNGAVIGQYPAALFGGAVGGSPDYTVIVGPTSVVSYDNVSGKVRWRRATKAGAQVWRTDGQYLYLAESAGYLSGAPVTGLLRIDIATGAEQQVIPFGSTSFAGSLAAAYDSVVLFTSAAGTTAYDGYSGLTLWSVPGAIPEGYDPVQGLVYLTRGSTLLAVQPVTGRISSTLPGISGDTYVIRGGIALGLDLGSDGTAWGYDLVSQRAALTTAGLGWPHYFSDLSGVGGSADPDGSTVVIAACGAATPTPSGSAGTGSGSPAPSAPGASGSGLASPPPPASLETCTQPELVGLSL
jgi:hypothetical protein